MENTRHQGGAKLKAAGIVALFASPLLAAPLSLLTAGHPELGTGIPLLWGLLSLSFGVQASGDYLAARARREQKDPSPEEDDRSTTRRAA